MEDAKVKIFLRRKNNEDQGGVGLPLVGNQATGKTSQNWNFFLDTGRPSHGRRRGAEKIIGIPRASPLAQSYRVCDSEIHFHCFFSASPRLRGEFLFLVGYNPRSMNKPLLLLLLASSAVAQTKVDPARVARLLARAVVLDLHDDTTQMIVDEAYNMAEKPDFGQVDIPRMRTGHVTGIFLSIWTDTDRLTPIQSIRRTLEQIDAVRRETARHPADLAMASTAGEILAAKKRGRIAILMGLEGGSPLASASSRDPSETGEPQ